MCFLVTMVGSPASALCGISWCTSSATRFFLSFSPEIIWKQQYTDHLQRVINHHICFFKFCIMYYALTRFGLFSTESEFLPCQKPTCCRTHHRYNIRLPQTLNKKKQRLWRVLFTLCKSNHPPDFLHQQQQPSEACWCPFSSCGGAAPSWQIHTV